MALALPKIIQIEISNFAGGLNNAVASHLLKNDEMQEASGWTSSDSEYGIAGSPTRSPTFTNPNVAPSGAIAKFLDNTYWASGAGYAQPGGSIAVGGLSGAPAGGKYVTRFKNRLWIFGTVSNPNRVWVGKEGVTSSWVAESSASPTFDIDGDIAMFDIEKGCGNSINGICNLQTVILVFMSQKIAVIHGSDIENFDYSMIADAQETETVGLANVKSLVSFDTFAIFRGAMGLYSITPHQLVYLSEKLRKTFAGSISESANAFRYRDYYILPLGTSGTVVYDIIQDSFFFSNGTTFLSKAYSLGEESPVLTAMKKRFRKAVILLSGITIDGTSDTKFRYQIDKGTVQEIAINNSGTDFTANDIIDIGTDINSEKLYKVIYTFPDAQQGYRIAVGLKAPTGFPKKTILHSITLHAEREELESVD